MVTLNNLLSGLGYTNSAHYHKVDLNFNIRTAFSFGPINDKGIAGVYFFDSDSTSKDIRSKERPAVFIAQADTLDAAREIHRTLWNLGNAPFLIILLPNQVRIYTGFQYSQKLVDDGLLDSFQVENVKDIGQLLGLIKAFQSSSIDSGLIWKSEYYKRLDHEKRVDKKLLKNLEDLGKALDNRNLPIDVCHSLIGKYVYLSYLKSRGILIESWITQKGINYDDVFSRNATVSALRKLVEELEEKFNGTIFPIDFEKEKDCLHDEHISLVASVFNGDEIINPESDTVRQLHLDFQAYDFSYIPVETLSAIYEQFIRSKKEEGAIYTPEVLADFVLSEMEYIKPLERNMKVFDPACGSGVFLVLAYRRLIEKEISRLLQGEKLKPQRLREILVNSIYGVERQTDACYVAEFSLILTLLHYIEPHDLESIKFKFPNLHNENIFNCDFFNTENKESTSFWQKIRQFDWITGNPPWIEINTKDAEDMEKEKFAYKWISSGKNKKSYPIADYRIAEAFSWLVTELSSNDGIIGLLLPATSLFNEHSLKYRTSFFTKNDVIRITNFANLRDILFGKHHSGVLPAMTMVYRKSKDIENKTPILHYGPFFVNQISHHNSKPWVIVINESEIKTISPYEAMSGDSSLWKLALWGTQRDKRTLDRIKHNFPMNLQEFCARKGWDGTLPQEGAQLRESNPNNEKWPEVILPEGQRIFNTTEFGKIRPGFRFSIPSKDILKKIEGKRYIRYGQKTFELTTPPPHILISPSWQNYAIYSDENFIIPPRQLVISAPKEPEENADYLRALTIYLSSSLVAYYVFFHAPQWGIWSQRGHVITSQLRYIPTPEIKLKQAKQLSELHKEIVAKEQSIKDFIYETYHKTLQFNQSDLIDVFEAYRNLQKQERQKVDDFAKNLQKQFQNQIDNAVLKVFNIPIDIMQIADEFINRRLLLDVPSERENIVKEPTGEDLLVYAHQLRDELDSFVMGEAHHRINMIRSKELIECVIEITSEKSVIPIDPQSIKMGSININDLFSELNKSLREEINPWVYVQRGLRLFDGPRVHIYKTPRFIDWTSTQALNDAADIIGDTVKIDGK